MAQITPLQDKDFEARKPYFGIGVYEVYITEVKKVTPESGAPYLNVSVLGEDDKTTDIRMYISEAAAQYTIANLARIAVHNKSTEKEKDGVRTAFKAIDDTDKLDDAFLAKFKDMQAWILVDYDRRQQKPNGGYYTRASLYSYIPEAPEETAEDIKASGQAIVDQTTLNEIPF